MSNTFVLEFDKDKLKEQCATNKKSLSQWYPECTVCNQKDEDFIRCIFDTGNISCDQDDGNFKIKDCKTCYKKLTKEGL